ncbi:phosphoribosyltransferase-like protein [Emticicia agri]|uniref:PRTase-CE domain-containing protein n=1 Tax=Emticicia agri TaxID=2492393 RepID=A0A4V1ZC88_9BACT|nr:ATP-binding protein [Emticicia agri]RYU91810.1 hypothetical protein EWM59_26645 [Emticicia agri]
MSQALKNLDKFIEKESNLKSIDFLENLSSLIKDVESINHKKSFMDFLFDKENEKNIQRLISFSFIRILSNNNYNHLDSCKHQVLKIIQLALPDLCHQLKISDKTETFEKESILTDFLRKSEKEFDENLVFTGNISDLNGFQQSFRRLAYNTKKNPILIEFTEDLLNKSQIDKIFTRIDEYLDSSEELKYEQYTTLNIFLNSILQQASELGTKYSINYILNSFTNIKEVIDNDIERSPFFLPAKLEIFKTEKKYPLLKGISNKINIGISNKGKGYAQNVRLGILDYNKSDILFPKTEQLIGTINFKDIIIEFDYEVINTTSSIILELELTWESNIEKNNRFSDFIELQSQIANINWEEIKGKEPYNLEPVDSDAELIGRDSILQKLRNMQNLPLGSSFIFGQRRVGKTSIVKTLLNTNKENNFLIQYIEAGDWNDAHDTHSSMNNLGIKICKKIRKFNSKFSSVPIPEFNGSLNKLSDFLEDIEGIDDKFKFLLVLDEFDRIPRDLYERGEIGQSFVLTLRSISNRPQFGFILVGGEKLEYILTNWMEFNKFTPIRVDYFSKERDWDDFKKLIRKPVENILEVSDSAINFIYEETAGNPYFTKKICMELFTNMISNRDIHVTENEIKIATVNARNSANIGATDFSHFWEDGIKGKIEKEEEISIKRRKILIIIAKIILFQQKLTKQNIIDKGLEFALKSSDIEKELSDFVTRKIINFQNDEYSFVVNFFKDWLINGGTEKIASTFEQEEKMLLSQQLEEKLRIKTEEINSLQINSKVYKGMAVTTTAIRNWLNQFEDIHEQRIIFKLLQNFKLYTEEEIREKLKKLFEGVQRYSKRRNLIRVINANELKRSDFIVSYLDSSPAKGASFYTKLFANENKIYAGNVCTPELIQKKISENPTLKGLIIIDDFIGTGNTIIENFKNYFDSDLCRLLNDKKIFVIVGVITGFLESKELVENALKELDLEGEVMILDILNNNDRCFDPNLKIFDNSVELRNAKTICFQKGEYLEPKAPLGYSDSQTLIAFPQNCPNNTLPIFWKRTDSWVPLFQRN